MPRLENWSIIGDCRLVYQVPECQGKQLNGEIYNDESDRFKDGERIVTTRIIDLDLIGSVAKTRNTKYILGKMSDEYAGWLDMKINNKGEI